MSRREFKSPALCVEFTGNCGRNNPGNCRLFSGSKSVVLFRRLKSRPDHRDLFSHLFVIRAHLEMHERDSLVR